MSEFWVFVTIAFMAGLLLGRWFGGWTIWGYIYSKMPDEHGHRTGIYLKDNVYYIISSKEYVDRVMTP